MSNASEFIANAQTPCRILLYGQPKTKKTWWALCALKAGYNVVIIDMDDGIHILNAIIEVEGITPADLERLTIVSAIDYFTNPTAALFMANFMRGTPFYWNQKTQTFSLSRITTGAPYFEINPKLLTEQTVVIWDSWSALSQSISAKIAQENGVTLEDAKKEEMRDVYGGASRFLNVCLTRIHSFNCHVIVIAHETEYVKTERNKATKKEEIISKHIQPISSSGPHGSKMGSDFSDILHFMQEGVNLKIDTQRTSEKDSGSRHLPPKKWNWKELDFGYIAQQHNWPKPDLDFRQNAFVYHPSGEPTEETQQEVSINKTIDTAETAKRTFKFGKKG